jgi:glycosyltransferase involved in cell wall biosynthesis
MQDFSPDVIHVQCLSANAEYAVRVKQRLHLPLIVTLQGEFTMDAGGVFQRPDVQAGVRRVLGHADLITGCSAKTLADGEAICGYSFGSRARVIFNGAKVGDFSTAKAFIHPKPYVLALGRAVRQKGFDVLLRAWALLKETQWDLLIAGEGPELPALATLSRELCLEKSVHLLGRADRSRVTALFAGCDIFALPSRADEGLPVVCAEALAAGRATVATRVGGVPEVVIDGTTGLIVPKEDAPALAGALRLLIDAPVLRAAFADAARRRSNQFSWTAITDQYLEAYRSVIASTKASCKSCLC